MIGKVYISTFPFFDRKTQTNSFKSRPCLIIGKADEGDFVVLPISSINDKSKVDPVYDIPLKNSAIKFLDKDCYLRTHKQTTINLSHLRYSIGDLKADYNETYLEALSLVEEFQKKLLENAL